MKVSLEKITDALAMTNDEHVIYYDSDKDEIGFVFEADSVRIDIELEDALPENAVLLPSLYEINEYNMMEDFVYSLEDKEMQKELFFAINGRGAFRNFKHLIRRYSIQEEWYDFKHEAYTIIAKKWCKNNDLTMKSKLKWHHSYGIEIRASGKCHNSPKSGIQYICSSYHYTEK